MPFEISKLSGGKRYQVRCATCGASAALELPGTVWHLESLIPQALRHRLAGEKDPSVATATSDNMMLNRLTEAVAKDLRANKCTHSQA
jgi:hypothetical protein